MRLSHIVQKPKFRLQKLAIKARLIKKTCPQISFININKLLLLTEKEYPKNNKKVNIKMAEQKHTQDPLDMEEALSTSEAFLIKYKGRILGTIAAVVIIIAGFMGYKHFISDPNEVKASEALFKGEQYFGADNFETALNGDSIGYKGFLKVADEFSGTAAGNLANAYAGICYAQLVNMKMQ